MDGDRTLALYLSLSLFIYLCVCDENCSVVPFHVSALSQLAGWKEIANMLCWSNHFKVKCINLMHVAEQQIRFSFRQISRVKKLTTWRHTIGPWHDTPVHLTSVLVWMQPNISLFLVLWSTIAYLKKLYEFFDCSRDNLGTQSSDVLASRANGQCFGAFECSQQIWR